MGTWDYQRAKARIEQRLKEVEKVDIVQYTRDMSLENIPKNKAYVIEGTHMYLDIYNFDDLLDNTDFEGERCHQRTLRFLNQHQRAAHRVLNACDATRVDFHGQRLHALVSRPYKSETDAEKKRIQRGVAIAQLLIDVLAETGDDDEKIPNALVRVGIDSGKALAVNNGRRGGREPLFLGSPANVAAKYSAGKTKGIYLTNNARAAIGLEEVPRPKQTALTVQQIKDCQDATELPTTKDKIVKEWREDMDQNPIGDFSFSGHTPPMKNLDLTVLTPKNSRRQDLVSLYADIDGFTKYVGDNIDTNAEDVVRTLHVLRSEMNYVLHDDFEGKKIRFIGDCMHGLLCVGTAQTTEEEATVSDATLCAGALRSSFELAMTELEKADYDPGSLGLAIGFEFGPTATTRLGMQGSRVRASISRAVRGCEKEQLRCNGQQTAIGQAAYRKASAAVKKIFGADRIATDLDYEEAVAAMAEKKDGRASAAVQVAMANRVPAVAKSATVPIRPYAK